MTNLKDLWVILMDDVTDRFTSELSKRYDLVEVGICRTPGENYREFTYTLPGILWERKNLLPSDGEDFSRYWMESVSSTFKEEEPLYLSVYPMVFDDPLVERQGYFGMYSWLCVYRKTPLIETPLTYQTLIEGKWEKVDLESNHS